MEAFGARVFLPTAAAGRAAQAGNGVGCRQLLRAHASPSEPNRTARIASAIPFFCTDRIRLAELAAAKAQMLRVASVSDRRCRRRSFANHAHATRMLFGRRGKTAIEIAAASRP